MIYANVYHGRPEQYEAKLQYQGHRHEGKHLPSYSSGQEAAAMTSSKQRGFLFRGSLSIFMIGMPFLAVLS